MQSKSHSFGRGELAEALQRSRVLFWFVGLFSVFVNMLMLTGPLYMMQVYDRVLGSRSEATLVALTLLVVFFYGMMGFLDTVRGRVMRRVAARFQASLDGRVFDAMLRRSTVTNDRNAQTGLADLEAVQRMIGSPVAQAAFDLPFTPFFLAAITLFHPMLGVLSVFGGVVLVIVAIFNQRATNELSKKANGGSQKAAAMGEQLRSESEMIQAVGMRRSAFERWLKIRVSSLKDGILTADRSGDFTSLTKVIRLFLQSAMLGLGAYLSLEGEITPGSMIAGSILLGRALAPIEMVVGQWPAIMRARQGWDSLGELLGTVQPEVERMALPKPKARLEAQALTVVAPGETRPQLRNVSFVIEPGSAVGVIGPSGAGKSTLARALTGAWRPAAGTIRLDGAALSQYDPDVLGSHIGYLPQQAKLFEGTIAQNIARLAENPDPAAVVEAAKRADAHEMIVSLPHGYDTVLPATGGRLSGGQMQRIGLARALYGDPAIVILDEPNSNLDNDGSIALNKAIRQLRTEGKSVLIMAHRPAAIQECNLVMVISDGTMTAFGPRDQVLKQMVANHQSLTGAKPQVQAKSQVRPQPKPAQEARPVAPPAAAASGPSGAAGAQPQTDGKKEQINE